MKMAIKKGRNGKPIKCKRVCYYESYIENIPTYDLVSELEKRKGVIKHMIGPTAEITVHESGPAVLLVVFD